MNRIEHDSLGSLEIPSHVLYGIHTMRAIKNFPIGNQTVDYSLIAAMIQVKKSAAVAHKMTKAYESEKADFIILACDQLLKDILEKDFFDTHFPLSAIQGGAGTSTNMNVNEVIANMALKLAGKSYGNYEYIHPLHHINKAQSTNDVYPTALRIAAIGKLRILSNAFAALQESLQKKEQEYADIIKLGRTQLMDALPIMLGQEFGAYAQAIARDRWRLYKVEERLRQISLGGTGIGTGINASHPYIFAVTESIRDITGIGLARAEYPIDLTQNQDIFVEVSGLLKSAAVNLMKISSDLRLMNSGPNGGLGEITLQAMQAGSSIMPGKVNPIIPEAVTSGAIKILALDHAVTMAASMGQFELNAFVPTIAESILESLQIAIDIVTIFRTKCIDLLKANESTCKRHLDSSMALITALSEYIGYEKAAEIAKEFTQSDTALFSIISTHTNLSQEELSKILDPFEVTKPGIPGQ